MAAAATLAEQRIRVTVFEALALPAGRARRIDSQGHKLDNGQHILIGAYTELYRLMRMVGVPQDALLRMPLEIQYLACFHFRRLPEPLGLVCGLLAARGISLGVRLPPDAFLAAL